VQFTSVAEERPDKPAYLLGALRDNLVLRKKKKHFLISQIKSIHARRFNFSEIAIEIFNDKNKGYFFNLFSQSWKEQFLAKLFSKNK
jgi:PH domain associated with Beige/BEACH